MLSKKEAALWYFKQGFAPIPACWPDSSGNCACFKNHTDPKEIGKAPLLGNNYQHEEITEEKILQWWTRWPEANISLLLEKSKQVVLDIDSKDALEEALEMGFVGENTPISTSGKGQHVHFLNTTGISTRSTKRGKTESLDILSRGMVIVPPSIHRNGTKYSWIVAPMGWPEKAEKVAEFSPQPDGIREFLEEAKRKREERERYQAQISEELPKVDVENESLPQTLKEAIIYGAPVGERSEVQFSVINRLIGHGWPDEKIISILLDERYGISEKFLERRDALKFAVGEVSRARSSFQPKKKERHLKIVDGSQPPRRPKIQIKDRQERDVRREAWDAIISFNNPPRLFQRERILMELRENGSGVPELEPVNEMSMRGILAEVADWLTLRSTKDGFFEVPAKVPDYCYKVMVKRVDERIPEVKGLVYSPIFASDGSITLTPGYDEKTKLFYANPDNMDVPEVPAEPSEEDLQYAIDLLMNELFVDFPFKDNASRVNALAALLYMFAKELVNDIAPLHLIDAPSAGTGKTFLAKTIHMVATGMDPAMDSLPHKEDETEKKILSILMGGRPVVVLDNTSGNIESEALNRVLTSKKYSGRILGQSRTVEVNNNAVWMMTGNNVNVEGDIHRRILWIRLDARKARPYQREEWTHDDLLGWIRENRGELVWACLTLIQNWIAKGRPEGSKRMASFERWSRVIGGILEAARIGGFLGNREELIEQANDHNDAWFQFFKVWWERYKEEPITGAQAFKIAEGCGDFMFEYLGDGGENARKSRFTRLLKQQKDVPHGLYVVRVQRDKVRNSNVYKLEKLPEV